jgi:hypothetical protein
MEIRPNSHFILQSALNFFLARSNWQFLRHLPGMKNRPIHENLDTAFVNLSALVRYLRRRQFDGSIRVELSGYEADITLTADNQIKVREYDQIAGRIAEGEEALQRILIRAREPGGIIHVYQNMGAEAVKPENPAKAAKPEKPAEAAKPEKPREAAKPEKPREAAVKPAPAPAVPAGNSFTIKPVANGNGNGHSKKVLPDEPVKSVEADTKPVTKLPDFPFELSNRVEEKAKQAQLPAADWQTLLNLTAELLRTVDNALANADLDFTAAFQKACGEIASDYPFFDPRSNTFSYSSGKVKITEQVSPKLFVAGINGSLRRIFDKLAGNEKFADIHRYTVQKISGLIENRKPLYDKYFITPQLEKIIGA